MRSNTYALSPVISRRPSSASLVLHNCIVSPRNLYLFIWGSHLHQFLCSIAVEAMIEFHHLSAQLITRDWNIRKSPYDVILHRPVS